jgi:hypothetical protein
MLKTLNPDLRQQLIQEITKQAQLKAKPMSDLQPLLNTLTTRIRQDVTPVLRSLQLTDAIKWMKKHLPAGVTGNPSSKCTLQTRRMFSHMYLKEMQSKMHFSFIHPSVHSSIQLFISLFVC